jgi:hypothetical protein
MRQLGFVFLVISFLGLALYDGPIKAAAAKVYCDPDTASCSYDTEFGCGPFLTVSACRNFCGVVGGPCPPTY